MSEQPQFTIRIDQNKYLPVGGQEVHAVLTIDSSGPVEGAAPTAEAAVAIIVDTSTSMATERISEARKAAMAAIDTLRDGVHFAIIAGTTRATMVYPTTKQLATVTPMTRDAAKQAVSRLNADGGTAIGSWLRLAADLLTTQPGVAGSATVGSATIKHAILLTDGHNQHETAAQLDSALAYCAGKFVCDCRGVGTGWEVAELRKVASTLLGTVQDIPEPKDLEADFRAMTQAAMGKAVADVALRVWTPQTAKLKFVKQVSPTLEDLTARRTESGPQSGDYPTGSWGRESREYHICVDVAPGVISQEMRAGWVKLVLPDSGFQLASGNILAQWSDDPAQSTRINPRVAHYTGQQELASLIQEGLQAHKDNDFETATARLGRARGLAEESGNEGTAKLLDRVLDFDAATGTARLKPNIDRASQIALDVGSVRTVRTKKDPEG
jgi:uncharacterized protein YegL